MALGDKVMTTRDIRSFDKNLKIQDDAIPHGMLGEIIHQDNEEGFIVVKFKNGLNGGFGEGLVDGLDAVEVVDWGPADDIMR